MPDYIIKTQQLAITNLGISDIVISMYHEPKK